MTFIEAGLPNPFQLKSPQATRLSLWNICRIALCKTLWLARFQYGPSKVANTVFYVNFTFGWDTYTLTHLLAAMCTMFNAILSWCVMSLSVFTVSVAVCGLHHMVLQWPLAEISDYVHKTIYQNEIKQKIGKTILLADTFVKMLGLLICVLAWKCLNIF